MRVVVIGLGSMGKRRIRLLQRYIENERIEEKEEWLIIGVDSNIERCKEVQSLYKITTYLDLDEALENEKMDCAVISSSPLSHASIITNCLKKRLHVFSEINLIDEGYEYNINLSKKMNRTLFISSTFLYRKEMEFIKSYVQNRVGRGCYHYHVGQYLPSWHPWENYLNFFVGNKKTNGCREIFAIELPWICNVFGRIKEIKSIHCKCSSLNIDYDDTYHIIVNHESGIVGTLVVDVITPKTERKLEIWTENEYLSWNGTPDSLFVFQKESQKYKNITLYEQVENRDEYNRFIIEDAYYEELCNYFNVIEKKELARHTFEKDAEILKLIDEIEK